jgi:Leucine-rich repeat (LRR) protein
VIPKEIFALPKLQTLVLARNRIREVPAEWAKSSLIWFNISENPLTGFPEGCPGTLKYLYCSYCGLKSVPESLAKGTNLIEFTAMGNELETLPMLPSVTTMYLSQNLFRECPPIPPGVTILDLSCCRLAVLPRKFEFPQLADLDLSHNRLSGCPSFRDCPALRFLKLAGNRISKAPEISGLEHLTVLNVAHTNIKYKKAPEMREFMTSQPGLFTNPSVKLIRASDAVGYSEMCGVRPDMEDAILIRENLKEGMAIYGVFDGHGGAKTSTYAAFLFARAAIERPEFSPRFMVNAFRESNEVLRKGNVPCGSTAAVVLRKENRLIVGHAGDARVCD